MKKSSYNSFSSFAKGFFLVISLGVILGAFLLFAPKNSLTLASLADSGDAGTTIESIAIPAQVGDESITWTPYRGENFWHYEVSAGKNIIWRSRDKNIEEFAFQNTPTEKISVKVVLR